MRKITGQCGVVNDRGIVIFTSFNLKQARAWMKGYNRRAKEQKDRGDLVSLRYAVGIVRHKQGVKP